MFAQVAPEDFDLGSSELSKPRKFRYSIHDTLVSGPVMNATNSMNVAFLRTYIADVVLCYPNEALLLMYRHQQQLRDKV